MSGGILGSLLGGMGGPQDPNAQGGGLLGGLTSGQNNYAMLNMGAALLDGQGWGGGLRSFSDGARMDQAMRQAQRTENEREKLKAAARTEAPKLGIDPAVAEAYPELVWQVAAKKYTPKDPQLVGSAETGYAWVQPGQELPQNLAQGTGPKANWEIKTIKNADGSETPVYFNPRTMETRPVPGYGTGESKQAQAQAQRAQSADIVQQDIDRIRQLEKEATIPVTGGMGQIASKMGGTNAHDVSALVDTIKANATFDKLQAMRAASPTGGALGAVSDSENKLLGAAIGSLDQSQSREQFLRNLQRVRKIYGEVIHGRGNVDEEGNPIGQGSSRQAVQGKTKSGVSWSAQ